MKESPYSRSINRLTNNYMEKYEPDMTDKTAIQEVAMQVVLDYSFMPLNEWVKFQQNSGSMRLFRVKPISRLGAMVCAIISEVSPPSVAANHDKVDNVKNAIMSLLSLSSSGEALLSQLSAEIPAFNGDKEMAMGNSTTVAWSGVSNEGMQAVNELAAEGKIEYETVQPEEYNGVTPDFKAINGIEQINEGEVVWWPMKIVKT